MGNVWLSVRRRVVIWRQGVVRALTHHIVSTVAIRRLGHGRTGLISGIVQVRMGKLWATLLRWHVIVVWAGRWRHRRHTTAWHKRLRLGIECVTVEASWNRVLTLWVMGVNIGRQSPVSIWNSRLRGRSGSRLVRARVESGRRDRRLLPPMLGLRRRLDRRAIRPRGHRVHGRLVPGLTWRLRILKITVSMQSTQRSTYYWIHLHSPCCYIEECSRRRVS